MARIVKCQVTGEKDYSDVFYPVKTNGVRKYYKSKEVYDNFIKQKEIKKSMYEYVNNEFFYGGIIPPVFIKKLNEITEYEPDVILKTFQYKKDSFDYAMSLSFNSDFQKSAYIIAILKNVINEVYKRIKIEEKTLVETEKNKVDMDVFNIEETKPIVEEQTGISRFFDEEDLF